MSHSFFAEEERMKRQLILQAEAKLKAAKAQLIEAKGKKQVVVAKPEAKKEKVGFFGRRKEKKEKAAKK